MRELEFDIVADERAPRISRARVGDIEATLGPRSTDVKLVLSELVTNSIRHSGRTERVRVRMAVHEEKIRLEVIDEGPSFPPDRSGGDGLGLTIVERLADKWGVHVEGTCTVWVEMGKSPPEAGSRD